MDEDTNQLIEAPEDEDINDLNEVTFGDVSEHYDVDWEQHHEELAYGDYTAPHTSLFPDDDIDFDELDLQGTDLEHKLSQLVVDDDDEEEDAGERSATVPIKRQPVNLDELFGPHSPPGLFDAEDIVMGHPNIWGSPARDSQMQGNSVEFQSLLKSLLRKPDADASTYIAHDTAALPESAKTLEEIEQALLQSGGEGIPPPPQIGAGSGVLTLEELEKRLRGEAVDAPLSAADSSTQHSSETGTDRSPVPGSVPPVRVPGLVTLPSGVPMRLPNPVILPRPGGKMPHFPHLPGQPWPPGVPGPQRLMNNSYGHLMGSRGLNSRFPMPMQQGFPGFGYGGGPVPPGMMRHPPDGGSFNQHRHFKPMPNDPAAFMNMMRSGMGPPPSAMFSGLQRVQMQMQRGAVFPQQRQQMFQQMQMQMLRQRAAAYQAAGRMFSGDAYRSMGGGQRLWHPLHRPEMFSEGREAVSPSSDEYAGLMLQREKDWVIKIQLLQLHTDNPYVDDYYYTCWSLKKMLKERQRCEGVQKSTDEEPALLLPQLAKSDTKAYTPAQFEGALGRLTSSSIHNPRQIITVHLAQGTDTDEARGVVEVKKFKEVLLRIEKGYDSLLDIEDTEKKAMAQPPDSRQALYEERAQLIAQLYRRLKGHSTGDASSDRPVSEDDDSGLGQIISIRKGLSLMLRLTPLLHKADSQSFICFLLRKMATRKEWQTEVLTRVYETVSVSIHSADLEGLLLYGGTICRGDVSTSTNCTDKNAINRLVSAVQNKFGLSVMFCLLSRGEVIYSTQSPLDLDAAHQNEWRQFVEAFGSAIELCEKTLLSQPVGQFPLVTAHLRRMLDKQSMLLIEDKLESILPLPNPPPLPVT